MGDQDDRPAANRPAQPSGNADHPARRDAGGELRAATPLPAAAPFAETPRLLVAGPADGALNRWADALLPALEQSLPPDTAIRRVEIGSADGVTGANQFEARGAPDGQTVLLVPGQAALAWMVGDPRAQFDVGHWVPVMAGASPGIVVGRPTVLAPNGRARVAAAGPGSFDLRGIAWHPPAWRAHGTGVRPGRSEVRRKAPSRRERWTRCCCAGVA